MNARGRIRTVILVSELLVLALRVEADMPTAQNTKHPTVQRQAGQSLARRFPLPSSQGTSLLIEASVESGHLAISYRHLEETTPIEAEPPGEEFVESVRGETNKLMLRPQSPVEPEMLLVPGGIFERGNDHGSPDQRPAHPVYLPSFEISASEVTNHLYLLFIEATGHPVPEGPRYGWKDGSYPRGQGNAPVVFVNWEDAVAFCRWLSRETGDTYRLPTEAEWEKAAQVIGDRYTSVGSIWEWCQDWYDRQAYHLAPRISPQGPTKGQRVRVMGIEGPTRVIRGGGFGRSSLSRRVTARSFFPPDRTRSDLGFRVVREFGPDPPRMATPTATPN